MDESTTNRDSDGTETILNIIDVGQFMDYCRNHSLSMEKQTTFYNRLSKIIIRHELFRFNYQLFLLYVHMANPIINHIIHIIVVRYRNHIQSSTVSTRRRSCGIR